MKLLVFPVDTLISGRAYLAPVGNGYASAMYVGRSWGQYLFHVVGWGLSTYDASINYQFYRI